MVFNNMAEDVDIGFSDHQTVLYTFMNPAKKAIQSLFTPLFSQNICQFPRLLVTMN